MRLFTDHVVHDGVALWRLGLAALVVHHLADAQHALLFEYPRRQRVAQFLVARLREGLSTLFANDTSPGNEFSWLVKRRLKTNEKVHDRPHHGHQFGVCYIARFPSEHQCASLWPYQSLLDTGREEFVGEEVQRAGEDDAGVVARLQGGDQDSAFANCVRVLDEKIAREINSVLEFDQCH